MEKIDVVRQMDVFRNILAYATNIGFFFGAGSSCAFGLPDINKLTTDVKQQLDESNQNTFADIEKYIRDTKEKNVINIEDILNHLRQINEITEGRACYSFNNITGKQAMDLDKEICNTIFKIIKKKEEEVDISDIRRFIAWYDSSNRGFIKEIYTTNYDMLFEMAMEANYTTYFDGFAGSYEPFFCPESIENFPPIGDSTERWIRLWKIHGSLNWTKKIEQLTSIERIVRVGKIDAPINELVIYPSKEKYNLSRKEPYVAYFDRLKKYLQQGELVFICSGYSFSDQHINETIYNALRQNKRLYVIVFCYTDDQVDRMSAYATAHMNMCVMGPTKVITNGILREWAFDNSTEDSEHTLYWNDEKNSFKLGDFRSFIEFLIENSGRKSMIEEIANAK